MVSYISSPDCRSLLPPLLACLPTAFVSPRPPPALLPLLTPILRQRVQLLSAPASSSTDSWLPLLCWESEPAKRLETIISESDAFELHPVSGEIDFGDVEDILYRRLDAETLQARIVLTNMGLTIIYLWCQEDLERSGNGWCVSEVRPWEVEEDHSSENWWPSMAQADEKAQNKIMDDFIRQGKGNAVAGATANGVPTIVEDRDDEDDDKYWAQYDQTPGRTPASKSPGLSTTTTRHARTTSEAEYYARYAQVQPEMENDDPSENREAVGEISLAGDGMTSFRRQMVQADRASIQGDIHLSDASDAEPAELEVKHPVASSPRTRSTMISHLEESAESGSLAEVAVEQHISTSIKSLFRLSKSLGIARLDFDRMVRTELETLGMINEDD